MKSQKLGEKTTEMVRDFFRLQFDLKKFEGMAYPEQIPHKRQSGQGCSLSENCLGYGFYPN